MQYARTMGLFCFRLQQRCVCATRIPIMAHPPSNGRDSDSADSIIRLDRITSWLCQRAIWDFTLRLPSQKNPPHPLGAGDRFRPVILLPIGMISLTVLCSCQRNRWGYIPNPNHLGMIAMLWCWGMGGYWGKSHSQLYFPSSIVAH